MAVLSIKSAGWLHGPGRTVWLGGAIHNFMAWIADGIANTANTKAHIVVFQGSVGSESVDPARYVKWGISSKDTTTRRIKLWNGTNWVYNVDSY